LGESKITKKQTFYNNTKKSEERLDLCLSAGNLAWWEMQLPSGKVIFNENKVKMLGYSIKEFEDVDYKAFTDLLHPNDHKKAMKAMRDHLEGKKDSYDIEYRIKTKNGNYKWFYDKGNVVEKDTNGVPLLIKGIVIDITKIKQSEILEKLSNQILKRLNESGEQVDQIKDIIQLIKQSSDFEAVGIRIKEEEDYPYYETNGFPTTFIKKADHICKNNLKNEPKTRIYDCMCGKVISGKTNSNYSYFTKNGSFWTNNFIRLINKNPNNISKSFSRNYCINAGYSSIALVPIRTDSEIIGLIQINDKRNDIFTYEIIKTLEMIGNSIGIAFARDKAIDKIQIDEKRFRLAQKAANIGSWDWNIISNKLTWSEKIEPMFGFKEGKFKGTYDAFLDCVYKDDKDFVVKSVNDCLKHKKRYAIEHRIVWPDGSIRWVLERGAVIRNKNDKPIRMLGVVQDITEKKEMEFELKDKKEHLEELVEERTKELLNANKKLSIEILEKKKAEEYSYRTRKFLRDIIDSASELIISFDMNNRISTWNKTAEKITGYKNIEVINRSVGRLDVFDDPKMIMDFIKTICEKQKSELENIILKTKDNEKKIIRVTGTIISEGTKECLGVLFVGRDITKDLELHGKLLDGSGYLITSKNIKSSIDLFVNLILTGHKGLFISRGTPSIIKRTIPQMNNLKIILFSQSKLSEFPTISNLESLKKEIQEFIKKNKDSMVLVDGFHYLLTRFTFDEFISTLYEINDLISKYKSILFIRVDPTTISSQELAIFENELQLLPSQKIEGVIIEDEAYNILKFIYEQNQLSSKVSYKKVMKKFKIAYVTAAKKLEILEGKGLILTKREGKLRTIYITEKGKTLLHKRQKA